MLGMSALACPALSGEIPESRLSIKPSRDSPPLMATNQPDALKPLTNIMLASAVKKLREANANPAVTIGGGTTLSDAMLYVGIHRLEEAVQSVEASSRRLEGSTTRLGWLTVVLIGFTVLLAILTVWRPVL